MEIEIVTTKKKLTKSLVNQMQRSPVAALRSGIVMGYFIQVVKGCYKTILIRFESDYYTIETGWSKSERAVSRGFGKHRWVMDFTTPEKCDKWWDAYQRVIKIECDQIYV